MITELIEAVDVDRYPLTDLDSERGAALVARCRGELAETGACDLPGFLRPGVAEQIVRESMPARPHAYRTETTHNIEFSGREAELDPDDPLRIQVRSAKYAVAYDLIQAEALLRSVYESDALTRFVGAALEIDPIHRQADPLAALSVMFYDQGDELGWHFDNADFVVTLMLQPSEAGGTFEYVPMLRTPDDANPGGVHRLLTGDRTGVRTMNGDAGTLALFRGHLSPHRVTPIAGAVPRINAVLSYARTPDARLSASGQMIFYGRTSDG